MNDKELRLKVLSILYQAAKEGKPGPGTMADESLEGITFDEYRWASYYLITHHLAVGPLGISNAGHSAWAQRIEGRGIDIIENLIDKSIEQVVEKKISFESKSSSYVEQFFELVNIWSKNPDLLNQAWEYFTHLIESVL